MKKISTKVLITSLIMLTSSYVFAERGPTYISPNNDGVQDELEVPLKLNEKRYVNEWSFKIYNENDELVRTIGNKVKLPEKITFKNFFKAIFTPKTGVEVPATLVWNGILEDGTVAPDGIYYYQFEAIDDNKNIGKSSKLQVIVDNTPPEINLKQLSGNEKNFGEGAKSTLRITQSGSAEKLWTAKISDAEGKTVRSYVWENAEPLTITWNGTDDNENLLSDGVYTYEITSTDEAGNKSEKAQISNIIFSTEKPQTAISISGSRYFAPQGNTSPQKTLKLNVTIPSPKSAVNALTSWALTISDKDENTIYRTYSDQQNPPSTIVFDGKNDDGTYLAEGEYKAKLTAHYLNGYAPEPLYSPVFVIDNTPPLAQIELPSERAFNGTTNYVILQQAKPEEDYTGPKSWTGKIIRTTDSSNKALTNEVIAKQFDFGNNLPERIEWNGIDDSGLLEDGSYYYQLTVYESAGNTATYGSAATTLFTLDTSTTEIVLSVNPTAFSPNGDNVQDKLIITPIVKSSAMSGISSYKLQIFNEKDEIVKTLDGKGNIPRNFEWDGFDDKTKLRCSDGKYYAKLQSVSMSNTSSEATSAKFTLDVEPPVIEISVPYTDFSPEPTSSKQNLPVKIENSSAESKWTAEIRNQSSRELVKTFTWQNSQVADFVWDGTDESGNKAANAKYYLNIATTDEAGNSASVRINNINLDARQVSAYITNELEGFSPNGDGFLDTQKFEIKLGLTEGISNWNLKMLDSAGNTAKTFSSEENQNLPRIIEWAGEKDDGTIADGKFIAKLHVEYSKGNAVDAESGSFVCTANPPQLDVETSPRYFSPDNDGNDDDLRIRLKASSLANLKNWSFRIYDRNDKQFWMISGKTSIAERIVWDGRGNNGELVQSAEDYKYVFTVADDLGMENSKTGKISVDVLVIRDENSRLRMQVPSIVFRGDNADFNVQVLNADGSVRVRGITQEQADNNQIVLKRISDILKKFNDYKVTVVGHANIVTGTEAEKNELTELSQRRAQYVKEQLVKLGISSARLTVEGRGGDEPVADTSNPDVNWKNRRVEFILEK